MVYLFLAKNVYMIFLHLYYTPAAFQFRPDRLNLLSFCSSFNLRLLVSCFHVFDFIEQAHNFLLKQLVYPVIAAIYTLAMDVCEFNRTILYNIYMAFCLTKSTCEVRSCCVPVCGPKM